ncbi:MAG: hypothetical protein ACI861_000964 [Paracoccaceae bacterium]|jgi:uncharacterized protein YkwD
MGNMFLIVPLGLALTAPVLAYAACEKPAYSAPFLQAIPTTGINQTLFSETLNLEASYVRCQKGRNLLSPSPKSGKVATAHSAWMARGAKLSHKGARGFKSRMRSTGLAFKTTAENIAAFDRFQFPKGQFKVRNAAACKFATQAGASIAAHSYASLAAAVVQGWMGSTGHRKNLLNRRLKISGGGLAFDRKAPLCGRFYITQNYLG